MIRVLLSVVVLVALSAPASAGIFANLFGRVQRSASACANGQCGVSSAIKAMPLPAKPLPSGTKPVRPVAPKPKRVQ